MNPKEFFQKLQPDFFQQESIRALPADRVFTELVMDLRAMPPQMELTGTVRGITFREYEGELTPLREAVSLVEEDWLPYFTEGERYFCAFSGKTIAAFCCLSDMGRFQNLRIGGPGCVGTVPAFRRQGIGLEMVRQATQILRRDGFDLSWIHYTHLAPWYSRLGYEPVLWWNREGILREKI